MSEGLLFSPFTLRSVTFPNRVLISPMSQYSAADGFASDWHLVNAGRFAMGGAGTVMVEATAVTEDGRGTPGDIGLWRNDQVEPLARIASFIADQGAIPAIQLNHAGRKSARQRPWHGGGSLGREDEMERGEPGWLITGPTEAPFAPGAASAAALRAEDMPRLAEAWGASARRAASAGFKFLELHAAHGYLLHQFLSPLANQRSDDFGGTIANRMRFPLMVIEQVRAAWPDDLPLALRISAKDWIEGGWAIEDSIGFAREAAARGVDIVDCSSGGFGAPPVPRTPGYQAHLSAAVRAQAGVPTIAVGLILDGDQAERHLRAGDADLIAVGREALISPNWALLARQSADPAAGFQHWPEQAGWWLARREITSGYRGFVVIGADG